MKQIRLSLLIALILLGVVACVNKKNTNSKEIENPKAWSVKYAESIMKQFPDMWTMEDRNEPIWSYTYGLMSQAYLKLWKNTNDKKYFDYAKSYADELIDEKGIIKGYKLSNFNIDNINPGKMLFILYKETNDIRYKNAIDTLRKQLKNHPRTKLNGFWHKKRYPWQMWLDGIYMGSPFYAQYGKEFNQPENFDDVAHQILLIEEKTRDDKTGLLYHAWDESKKQKWSDPETGRASQFWGRAIGWYSMALVDVLDFIPEDHAKRNEIIAVLQRLVEAIVKVQDEETGLWYQVLDQGDREGNYLEGSVSSMFSYTMLKAIKKGYIDNKYLTNAKKAYEGIINNLITTDENNNIIITQVCAVGGLGGNPYRDGSYEYYINEKRRDNDPKAAGPFIMASILYEELDK